MHDSKILLFDWSKRTQFKIWIQVDFNLFPLFRFLLFHHRLRNFSCAFRFLSRILLAINTLFIFLMLRSRHVYFFWIRAEVFFIIKLRVFIFLCWKINNLFQVIFQMLIKDRVIFDLNFSQDVKLFGQNLQI